MTKNLLFLLAAAGLILNVGGCTSKTSQDESQVIENADVDKIEAEELDAPPQEAATDESLQAALGETTTDSTGTLTDADLNQSLESTTETTTTTTDVAAAPTLDESSLNDVPQPSVTDSSATAENLDAAANAAQAEITATPTEEPAAEASALLAETPAAVESSGENTSAVEASTQESTTVTTTAKSSGSNELKKIALTSPYQATGGWVNTVYVARPGEKLKDISQTIFGSDKTKELKKVSENSYLKYRSPKAGDKIYYISPNRPEDSSKTLFYYEDMGMVPETYVAKKGDNLKKVAKEILGYDKAWVEMWTSNSIDSKAKLQEGDTLKYWRSASSINSSSAVAQNTTPPPADNAAKLIDASQASAAGMVDNNANLPPPPDMNSLPPPPPDAQMAANTAPPPDMNSLPPPPTGSELPPPPTGDASALPPPPPPPEMAPPPPPPPMDASEPVARKNVNAEEEAAATGALDNDTMMSLGAVGVLTAALAFILIRRKKKKAAEQAAMSETNVGT